MGTSAPPRHPLCLFLALLCVNHLALTLAATPTTATPTTPTTPTTASPRPTAAQWRSHVRGNFRHNAAVSGPSGGEIKELMTNLHDRVGILATLDEDQRHRLEVIDKKVDQLLDSSSGRMESLRAQQLNFQQRLDSFEHIQRLTRHTLDELKGETDLYLGSRAARELRHKQKNRDKLQDLSRTVRAAPQEPAYVAENMANLFSSQPSRGMATPPFPTLAPVPTTNGTDLEVFNRLDALATLLVSVSYNVRETQQNVARLVQNTNNIRRRLGSKNKAQSGQLGALLPAPVAAGEDHATSCLQSYLAVNGILRLQLTPESESFYVPCEDDGWTVIMNRSTDELSFERSWLEYKEGFGNLAGDFFIGLDKLHALTSSSLHELRIWLQDFEGHTAIAGYDSFAISGERELYALSLLGKFQDQLQPSAGDSLSYQAGAKFSTFDSDNDNCVECSCAQRHKGGGWFNACGTSNLMGVYRAQGGQPSDETGIYWDTFQGKDYSLRSVKMLIRPVAQDDARR